MKQKIRFFLHSHYTFWIIAAAGALFYLSFAFSYQLHGSMFFYTDIGRDMLLIRDLEIKKVVFIGGRTSLQGVFHGPLWHYINLPAFMLGKGDPMVLGWWWIFLTILFLVSVYWVTQKFFDNVAAVLATIFVSINMIVFSAYFTNPIGALFCMPLFIYFMASYLKTQKVRYLLFHVLLGGAIIQFEMMIGVPLIILSFLLCLFVWRRTRHYNHFFGFFIILFPLSTFFMFDLRHHFMQVHAVLDYVIGKSDPFPAHRDITTLFLQRFEIVSRALLGIFPAGRFETLNSLPLLLFGSYFIASKSNRPKISQTHFVLLYYFIGFLVTSFVLKDTLLFSYYYPLCVLPIMLFAGLYKNLNKRVYVVTVIVALLVGIQFGQENMRVTNDLRYYSENDWSRLRRMSDAIFLGPENDVGYFVYAPDVYAYQQKYAVSYTSTLFPLKTSHAYQKRPVTYLLIAAPTRSMKEVSSSDWKRDKLRILRPPDEVKPMEAGYTLEKYYLTDAEVKEPVDFDVSFDTYFR